MTDGKIQVQLRKLKNDKGEYWIGNTRLPAQVDLDNLVWFARQLPNGTLEISIERFDEEHSHKKP